MGLALHSLLKDESGFQLPSICPSIFKANSLSITGVQRIQEGVVDISYEFKNFTQMQADYPRVAAVQFHSALCEGFYEAVGLFAAENALPFGIDLNYVLKSANLWTLLKVDVLYRKEIKPGERTVIRFEIADISLQRFSQKQCSVTVNFSGCVSGQMTELLPEPPLFI
jgi:hypothetical protein